MPLILTRIDDRLIHGQVVVGWGSYLKPDRIILCSDSVANTPWQKELFGVAGSLAPENIIISIWTEKETLEFLTGDESAGEKVILLLETPEELYNLIREGARVERANIGGMHFKPGKRQLTPYIFVDDSDVGYLKKLINENIWLEGQDTPTAKKVNVGDLLHIA